MVQLSLGALTAGYLYSNCRQLVCVGGGGQHLSLCFVVVDGISVSFC